MASQGTAAESVSQPQIHNSNRVKDKFLDNFPILGIPMKSISIPL